MNATPDAVDRRSTIQVPTGITGLDLILGGGLPRGRVMLVIGGAGSGKSILALQFAQHGASEASEPAVYSSFEEAPEDILANARSFGWDLDELVEAKRLAFLNVAIRSSAGVEIGDFDLSPLLIRLENAIKKVGARRVVLDGLSNLLASFSNENTVRTELLALFGWLKERDLTVVVTAERGSDQWTRLGFEEYLADGLTVLDNRVEGQVAKRTLRVVKCRSISHETSECPFLIGAKGIALFPVTAAKLDYPTVDGRMSSGISGLDEMLGSKGFQRGSSILVSGVPGSGKTSIGASLVDAACARGERAMIFAFEEPKEQIVRNMASIGMDLQQWIDAELLQFEAARGLQRGLEGHLTAIQSSVARFRPSVFVLDPISSFDVLGSAIDYQSMIIRLTDFLRGEGITSMFTSLLGWSHEAQHSGISSMADCWIQLRMVEDNAERNNIVQIMKARGMAHSTQVKELNFSAEGIEVEDAYIGLDGIVIGSERVAREAKDKLQREESRAEIEKRKRAAAQKRKAIDAQIQAFEAEYEELVTELAGDEEALNAAIRIADDAKALIEERRKGGERSNR